MRQVVMKTKVVDPVTVMAGERIEVFFKPLKRTDACIVARVATDQVSLISLTDGNRYKDPSLCKNGHILLKDIVGNVTEDEYKFTVRGTEYTKSQLEGTPEKITIDKDLKLGPGNIVFVDNLYYIWSPIADGSYALINLRGFGGFRGLTFHSDQNKLFDVYGTISDPTAVIYDDFSEFLKIKGVK